LMPWAIMCSHNSTGLFTQRLKLRTAFLAHT
jgi:hypothetical protein